MHDEAARGGVKMERYRLIRALATFDSKILPVGTIFQKTGISCPYPMSATCVMIRVGEREHPVLEGALAGSYEEMKREPMLGPLPEKGQ
jgi:hypothetical protein